MPTATADGGKLVQSTSVIVCSTESGRHLLRIEGYSRIKDAVGTGNYILSRGFHVGGYNWYIRYYPNGNGSYVSDHISVELYLGWVNQLARAQFTFSLLDQAGQPSHSSRYGVYSFSNSSVGPARFIQKSVLERSGCLKDDCVTIRCDITVMKWPEAKDVVDGEAMAASPPPPVAVPPSDLARHLAGLLATGEGADVTFEVDGRAFMAHRNVLAARSPVFRAALFGPGTPAAAEEEEESFAAITTSGGAVVVRVDDMEARDFEALLHYMYTDALPEMKGGDTAAMLPDLVAAANRYKMERLRLACEDKLCEYINVRTVAAMLAFAGEHHCDGLKKKCLQLLDDPANLRAIVKTEGLDHLTRSHPSVLKDLIAKLAVKV